MDAVAEEIPDEMEVVARGKGLRDVFSIDPEEEERRIKAQETWQSKFPQERREENRQKLLAYLTEVGSLGQGAAPADE